ncbi:hypothetical protein ASPWEDRAFT_697288 [Aspergillus wentii DTO 134E9]|uniref:Uncharacterized protein n=1 Tax=Aspergillus wentii DTO 134E9 TaxID=1073089 RepID=A0A1L9R9M9_ASPWE|nr:uncharacterized protein ASPWEDRAFT_697288 [Aspergillus wentii DTO 134E9]OJJ31583.1 hypothetical protein ASPWEDRAFT_697288 [Aspergillus wentii DTO 134E9]
MEIETTPGVHVDGRWPQMDAISQNIQVLSEETLAQIVKGPLRKFTLECEDDMKVSQVWRCMLKTFSTTFISHPFTTVSCNALSAFMDAALVSQNERTRQIIYSHETWLTVFEVYLDRFEESKPKPMKQVLTSLVKILAKYREGPSAQSILAKIVDATIPSIVLGESRLRLKASLVCWEIFLRKSAILPSELILMSGDWLLKNQGRLPSSFKEECETLSIDIAQFIQTPSNDNASKTTVAKSLVFALLTRAENPDFTSSAGAVMVAFFQKMKDAHPEDAESISSIWVAPVKYIVQQNPEGLESMSNNILHPLFGIDSRGFNRFINTLPLKSLLAGDMTDAPLSEYMVLFTALQVAKKTGLVHEDHYFSKGSAKAEADGAVVLKSEVIGQFLLHREPRIRIAALSLLITATATAKPLTSTAIRTILKGLPHMHAEPDSYLRGEILSLTRKLIFRLKGGILLDQENPTAQPVSTDKKGQAIYARSDSESLACLNAYLEFLKADLRPTASYPRHIAALKALYLILDSGLDPRIDKPTAGKSDGDKIPWKFKLEIFQPNLLRLLVDLLLDPFEEVRATSLSILALFPQDILLNSLSTADQVSTTVPGLINALSKAEQLASNTSRADHADTVARLYHITFCAAAQGGSNGSASQWWESKNGVVDAILKKLEDKLSLAGGLFNASMRDAPLHGYISALRYIVSMSDFYSLISEPKNTAYIEWKTVHSRITSLCDKIWDGVKPVLCIDSPEGHTDEPVEDLNVGPKDILSYSWRALREASLLLHATLSNASYGPKGENGLKVDDYEKIGKTSFIQLAELRHRGAFSTVSQTFTTCCQRCGQSKDSAISALPQNWYQDAKRIIFETASKLTRRSAGLPALATGILSSAPGGSLFQQVMGDLHEISRLPAEHDSSKQDLELPQVHAMNCLKDIFTNTRLGPFTEPFIMSALNLSADRMGSPIWALRNSGLMLFRALLTRMCRDIPGASLGFGGSSGSEPGARIPFQRYSGLLQLLSGLLRPSQSGQNSEDGGIALVTERVFPALELIGEKIPSVSGDEDIMLRELVQEHLKSSVWGIREHAARVYASLLNRSEILKEVQTLLDVDRDVKTQNFVHGKALCVRYALRRFASSPPLHWNNHIDEVFSTDRNVLATLFPLAQSPYIATALLEIVTDTAEKSIVSGAEEKLGFLLTEVFDTYQLHDVMDYIWKSSDSLRRSSSVARASSLLRRVLSWTTVLRMLSTKESVDLPSFFKQVSDVDSDAARWVLEQLQDILGETQRHRKSLLDLYSSVILGNYPEDVKAAAISNLATGLEVLLDFRYDNTKGLDLPWEALGAQIKSELETGTWSRDTSDAVLRLQGCLLAIRASLHQWQFLSDFELDLRGWGTKVQFAMQEETEFTTRHAAVSSLKTLGRVLRPLGSPPREDPVFLDIYLILYDMLNDDDEELRDIAASTASWVLSYSSVSPSKAVALASLPAAELLAEFIAGNYASSPLLGNKILRYIAGQEPRINGFVSQTKLTPVSYLVSEFRKESTVLFVEEKQNLFIDEIRDVDIWTRKLNQLTDISFDGSLIQEISKWVFEAVSYLAETTAQSAGADGLLGWASKPEVFTLGVRAISLAAAFSSEGSFASRYLGEDQSKIKGCLKSLFDNGTTASLHDEWLLRTQAALGTS